MSNSTTCYNITITSHTFLMPKKKIGRPPKYNDSIPSLVDQYTQSTDHPLKSELAYKILDVVPETISDWKKKHKPFSQAIKRLEMKSETFLNRCVTGEKRKRNQVGAMFLLKANHGYIETERRQLVGKDNKDLTVEMVNYSKKGKK